MKTLTGSKMSARKIPVLNGSPYLKQRLQSTKNDAKLERSWKRPNSKFLT